jgi:nicotinamidase-related amidase
MGVSANILDLKERFRPATLVLVDLDGEAGHAENAELDEKSLSLALENCRIALRCARQAGLPVAFVRHKPPAVSFLSTHARASWLRGFQPQRSDMVFERAFPSCYASMEFSDMAQRSGELVLAGIFGESSCLSTLVEASHRNHQCLYLADASVSRGRSGIPPGEMHRSVVGIASIYSEVTSMYAWVDGLSRKIGMMG